MTKLIYLIRPVFQGAKTTANERKVSKEMNLLVRDQLIIQKRFVKTHPHSYVSVYLLYGYLGAQQTPEHLAQLLYSLDAIRQHSLYGKLISEEIHWDTIGLLNHRAFNFEFTDLNGEKCSIENQRGKYVLLDFWASWCAPCRAENKELRNIWKKYKYKNFVIIGIADDDKSAKKWKEAIKKDKIGSWINILRGSETDQDINKLYSIQTIPTQILIDPQGIIIGRYNGNNEKEFDKKLFKIFK